MPRLQELQKDLLTHISRRLALRGFRSKVSDRAFYSPKPFGWASLHLSFIPHGQSDFDVTADVNIRVDGIEELINRDKKKTKKASASTIGIELGNLSLGRPLRWTVRCEADIKPVTQAIDNAIVSVAMPYIGRYSDLNEIYQVLTSNARQDTLQAPVPRLRCQRAVALAFLLKKEDLSELVARCEEFLRQKSDCDLPAFQQFVNTLLDMQPRPHGEHRTNIHG